MGPYRNSRVGGVVTRTSNRTVTMILGAGASTAYDTHRYPSLELLLPRMFADAESLSGEGTLRQGLYLAYAMRTAHQLDGTSLEGTVTRALIQQELERVKCLPSPLAEVFKKLESLDSATRAYWALTHAIGIYMFRMAELNLRSCEAHKALLKLIEAMLSDGTAVNVIDFNWDCLVERVWWSSARYRFGWHCGRNRRGRVVEGTGAETEVRLSELVERGHFRKSPLDEEEAPHAATAGLIKPHGDMCTFLRSDADVFYCGGRHGQTTTAIFPKWLADIRPDDGYVRSSIMPPTVSRFRHKHAFYDEEVGRLKSALNQSDDVIIIGWSASGPDEWYGPVFKDAIGHGSKIPSLSMIDLKTDNRAKGDLEGRVLALFGGTAALRVWWEGFSKNAVEWLEGNR